MNLYQLSFPNGKKYIGITSQPLEKRMKSHFSKYSGCSYLRKAIHKYGKENVKLTVLAECDNWELLCLAEQEAIEKFNSFSPNGYNLTKGGEGAYGVIITDETRQKMSIKASNKTLSHRIKISNGNKGKIMSKEAKQKLSLLATAQRKREKEQKENNKKQELSTKAAIRVKRLLREIAEQL